MNKVLGRKFKAAYTYESLKYANLVRPVMKGELLEPIGRETLLAKVIKLAEPSTLKIGGGHWGLGLKGRQKVNRFFRLNEKAIDSGVLMHSDNCGRPVISRMIANRLDLTPFLPTLLKCLGRRFMGHTTLGGAICESTDKDLLAVAGTSEFRKALAKTEIADGRELCINQFAEKLSEPELVEILQAPLAFRSLVQAPCCDKIHPRVFAQVPSEFFIALPNPPILHLARNGNLHLVPKQFITSSVLNLEDGLGRTILHHAARTGCVSAIPKDVITDAALLHKDSNGRTPFIHAFVGAHDTDGGAPRVSASQVEQHYNRITNPSASLKTLLDFGIQLPEGSATEAIRNYHNAQFDKPGLSATVTNDVIDLF